MVFDESNKPLQVRAQEEGPRLPLDGAKISKGCFTLGGGEYIANIKSHCDSTQRDSLFRLTKIASQGVLHRAAE